MAKVGTSAYAWSSSDDKWLISVDISAGALLATVDLSVKEAKALRLSLKRAIEEAE